MTDERLKRLLRTSIPPSGDGSPSHDLWPRVATRLEQKSRWSYVDLGLAVAAAFALAAFPEWLWLLSYHL